MSSLLQYTSSKSVYEANAVIVEANAVIVEAASSSSQYLSKMSVAKELPLLLRFVCVTFIISIRPLSLKNTLRDVQRSLTGNNYTQNKFIC